MASRRTRTRQQCIVACDILHRYVTSMQHAPWAKFNRNRTSIKFRLTSTKRHHRMQHCCKWSRCGNQHHQSAHRGCRHPDSRPGHLHHRKRALPTRHHRPQQGHRPAAHNPHRMQVDLRSLHLKEVVEADHSCGASSRSHHFSIRTARRRAETEGDRAAAAMSLHWRTSDEVGCTRPCAGPADCNHQAAAAAVALPVQNGCSAARVADHPTALLLLRW